jgi:adenine phosphoribosyltransferase
VGAVARIAARSLARGDRRARGAKGSTLASERLERAAGAAARGTRPPTRLPLDGPAKLVETAPVPTKPKTATRKRAPVRPAPTPRGGAARGATLHALAAPAPEGGIAHARALIRTVPDFPQKGILFKDITPLLADPRAFHIVLDALAERFIGEHVDAIVGIESRGFIFGAALAARLNASFVPVRKRGKLPAAVDRVAYDLEYGTAELEMHKRSIPEGAKVVVVDDLLATGGTAAATAELVRRQGGYVVSFAFVIELEFLGGRERLMPVPTVSLLHYAAGE